MNNVIQTNKELLGLSAYLYRDGLLNELELKTAYSNAERQGIAFITFLVKNKILSSQIILQCCMKNFGLPIFNLKNFKTQWLNNSLINRDFICRYRIVPLNYEQTNLSLGISDPTDQNAITAINFHSGVPLRLWLVDEEELEKILVKHYRSKILNSKLAATLAKVLPNETTTAADDKNEIENEPITEFVNNLLQDAIEKKISDIHIEPYVNDCRIRFRRDGILYEAATLPLYLALRIITRLKLLAELNIAEKRLPQDGRIRIHKQLKTDIRINTCPTLYGEKIVLRILDIMHINLSIDLLGLNAQQNRLFYEKISHPHGLILVTGPTGSGKTITLYSVLQYLNKVEKNIISIEDPIEIELHGINQVNINSKVGLDFAKTLRAMLRQDPDVIMIGEIRDAETAHIALQAAQTGHLVLSTLHTNSAIEALIRLQLMEIPLYQIISSVTLIIAQRLVRRLCEFCKEINNLPSDFPVTQAYKAIGCEHCSNGYRGRIGVFELIHMTNGLVQSILSHVHLPTLKQQAEKDGCIFLWQAGIEKVKEGITDLAEIYRVIGKI